MRAAFYKGTRPGLQGIYSRVVRLIDRGPYSHCELVFSDGISASASWIDGGVRFKRIDYKPEHWDFIDLTHLDEERARDWFREQEGAGYDLLGNVRFVLPIVPASASGWFCSEAMATSLGMSEAWRLGPNGLAAALRWTRNKRSTSPPPAGTPCFNY